MRKALFTALIVTLPLACDPPPAASTTASAAPSGSVSAARAGINPAPTLVSGTKPAKAGDNKARAKELCQKFIIVDGHIDVPYRLEGGRDKDGKLSEDVSKRTKKGDFDLPRAFEGGLNAPFMSIYIPAKHQKEGGAKALADKLIDMVEGIAKSSPDKVAIAHSTADVKKHFAEKKISLPLGIENGAAIESKLENLTHFHKRGVRYITLTHSKDNAICDSSYDDKHTHKGLSDFGKTVVPEMNRLGIMIDISHISDDTFHQVMELTKTPVMATHSSCRHFTPGFERNMSDEMIVKLAKNGGVIMINFGSGFLDAESRKLGTANWKAAEAHAKDNKLEMHGAEMKKFRKDYKKKHPVPFATVEKVADHIAHVVKLVGIDHVGLGSDFDGVGDSLPTGLKDVSQYPNLVAVLLDRGYKDEDIEKLLGGNALRVWEAVERYAAKQAATK
ncbi:dipeptidase [Endomicrobium sp. AH-315-J14]|nr:dipeptidase [Endomicrobium sp. AH-315-J14]